MEPPMTSCLHRIVASLFILAAGAQAAEVIALKGERTTVRFAVADELQVTGKQRSQAKPVVAGGRAAVQAAARHLLGSGAAAKVEPVVYLDGRLGDPQFRAIATRRILLAAAPGQDIARLAADHGLTLVEPVRGQNGWWMAEPRSPDVYAAIDATRTLVQDNRAALVWPQLQMPVAERYVPNDPMLADGLLWHLGDAPGIHVQETWDLYRGAGTNIAIIDGGVQGDHLDLSLNYRGLLSRDYINNDSDPFPSAADPADNHGTAIAGLAAASGDNGIGTVGVAWQAGIIASKVLNGYNDGRDSTSTILASDANLRQAMAQSTIPPSVSQECSVSNSSWGPIDNSLNHGAIGPLTLTGMREAVTVGRGGKGIPLVFPAGNGGWSNPNGLRPGPPFAPFPSTQDCTSFDGYLNRYAIGVAAYQSAPLTKAFFSESGPNLTISAPGVGLPTTDRSTRRVANTNPTFDNLGYTWWPWVSIGNNANFDGFDNLPPLGQYVWQDPLLGINPLGLPYPDYLADPDNLTYENGDYVQGVSGTSVAAPLVSGAAALMIQARPELSWLDVRQLMMHRGQDFQLPPFPTVPTGTIYKEGTGSHTWWGRWRSNAAGLAYNNWYGFGTIDVGRFVFGGTGNLADRYATTARDEPGALRWPLMPAMQTDPLTFEASYALPVPGDIGYPSDPNSIMDAPFHPPYPVDNVPDGVPFPMDPFSSRVRHIAMPITGVPPRFRVDAVELTVTLLDVGSSSYAPTAVPPPANNGASWGEYQVWLSSPNGTTALMGRQRPGVLIPTDNTLTVTMTELFHTNELISDGIWTFSIMDEVNNATSGTGHDNAIQARVHALGLKIYGHQTYATPSLAAPANNGVASNEGDQAIDLDGSGFARSASGLAATQVYWQPTAPAAGPVVEIPTTVVSDTRLRAYVPASLLNPASPGTATVFVANAALVVGRAGGIDAFDAPNTLLPTTVDGVAVDRYMKRCPGTDDRQFRYSRRPTLTPIPDISLPNGGPISVSTIAFDADVAAGLGIPAAETLTISIKSFNPFFLPVSNITVTGPPGTSTVAGPPNAVTVTGPGATGNGTYVINAATTGSSSGFAFIEVTATDGVLTTTRAFRVVIPTDEDPNSCGGGMGLALLGLPLVAWFIRRRRK